VTTFIHPVLISGQYAGQPSGKVFLTQHRNGHSASTKQILAIFVPSLKPCRPRRASRLFPRRG